MKKYIILIIFTFLLLAIIHKPSIIFAHTLKTDGSIGAVMHTDPDDYPIATKPTLFFFEFKDRQNKFDPKICDCRVHILKNSHEITSGELYNNVDKPTLDNSNYSYTFASSGNYIVKAIGKPTTPGAFQPFTLTYDVSVRGDQKTADNKGIYVLFGGIVVTGVLAAVFWVLRKKSTV